MKKTVVLMIALWGGWLAMAGQSLSRVSFYDEEDGLPHGHMTQLLQDGQGFMWFATWNGLCRFDGYEFRTFKSAVGDGCHMTTDRFRDIALRPDGTMVCRVDDDYYVFDLHTYRFRDMTPEEVRQAPDELRQYRQSHREDGTFCLTDQQGNQWVLAGNGVTKLSVDEQRTERLDIKPEAQVKCLFVDSRQRCWVATKDDAAVRVYAIDNGRLSACRYLGADGRLHEGYTRFGAAVYAIYESADGILWLCTKPHGLFRLHELSAGQFRVEPVTGLPDENVYDVVEDSYGRLWVATLGGGLCYTAQPQAAQPRFSVPKGYPQNQRQRLRHLHLTNDGRVLMATATDGLLTARVEQNADNMLFHCHQRESDRVGSLSSSALMNIVEDEQGRIYIGTESGGINSIEGKDLLVDRPTFRHYTMEGHQLPNDVVMSLTDMGEGRLMVVSGHLVSILDTVGNMRVLDAHYFNSDYRFSDALPRSLGSGRWLFGLQDGAFVTSTDQMYRQAYQPRVVLTGVSIGERREEWGEGIGDTLTLQPSERSITVHFAAIDYCASERISYAFRLLPSEQWNYIGHDRSATLLDLEPGIYRLEIRSTNADGQWQDNVRQLTLIVRPTFWESVWGRLLILFLILATLGAIAYTYMYIRRIKRKQHETLEAYLSLLGKQEIADRSQETGAYSQESGDKRILETVENDPMLKRVKAFVDENISNSDANVGDMAAAAATSRSGLQRKLKQTMGITPQDLLREARIKHACRLLCETDKTVAEVAYASGFTDPKYFSRCFKQSTGQSPTDYKSAER